ncbi:MAG: recombination mediator RecR [Ignavibacterium sp.]|uniref:recombination mediator RecR n=1 Tax=Ignavibacterium sp. TaxID=2651167 RepID=UPI004049CF30
MQIAETLLIAIDELSKLPGIGKKTAQRLALHIIKNDRESAEKLAKAIVDLKEKLMLCKKCFNLSEAEFCDICQNPKRDQTTICVVEEVSDVIAIEKSHEYNGLYHVLGGVLSPLMGVGAENIRIKELINRFHDEEIKEVILALNPDTEGETTSLYLAKLIKPLGIKVTRIARGIPIGGDLEFADEATIGKAMINRIDL